MVLGSTTSIKAYRYYSIFGCAFAIWIMAFYLLPSTIFSRISPFNWSADIFISGSSLPRHCWVLAIASILILLGYWRQFKFATFEWALVSLIALYISLYLITMFTNQQDIREVESCFKYVAALLTGLLAALVCRETKNAAVVLIALAVVQAVITLYYHKIGYNDLVSGNIGRAGGTYNNPTAVYTIMMLCIPLVISFLVNSKSEITQITMNLAATVLFAALMVTWYRGGVLALGVALVWFCYRITKSKRLVLAITASALILILTTFAVRTSGHTNFSSSERSNTSRYILWNRGVGIFKHHWLTGTGVGSLAIPVVVPNDTGTGTKEAGTLEPKNLFLFWIDEMGLGGGLLFIFFFITITRLVISRQTTIHYALGACWISLLVAGIFDTPFGPAYRLYAAAMVGSLLGATLHLNREHNNSKVVLEND